MKTFKDKDTFTHPCYYLGRTEGGEKGRKRVNLEKKME